MRPFGTLFVVYRYPGVQTPGYSRHVPPGHTVFLSQDIFDGPFPKWFFDTEDFFSRIKSEIQRLLTSDL